MSVTNAYGTWQSTVDEYTSFACDPLVIIFISGLLSQIFITWILVFLFHFVFDLCPYPF